MSWERQVSIKSGEELKLMREAGKINAEALKAASEACVAGASTWDVNAAAERVLDSYHVISPFKGVPGPIPFPASTCVSVNHVLVHGIPSKKMILREGDIVSVDCGTIYQGFVADSAFTIGVGKISEEAQHLLEVTEESLYVGMIFFDALMTLIKNDVSVIAEAAFQHRIWSEMLAPFMDITRMSLLICAVDDRVALDRFVNRGLGNPLREYFHGDKGVDMARQGIELSVSPYEEPRLDVPTYRVDTSGSYNPSLKELAAKILG